MLPTDMENRREFVELCIRGALGHYQALLREGYNPACARCAAISYLCRKIWVSWPIAAGYFDMQDKETP